MASLDREHGRGRSQERGRGRQTTYVVKKTVRDVGGAQYPMLTRTNYAEWVVLMCLTKFCASININLSIICIVR